MKTRLLLLLVALLAFVTGAPAQTLIDDYAVTERVDSTAWIDIDGIDSTVIAPTTTVLSCGSGRIEMGFTFMLGATACTHFSANVNGTVGLGNSAVSFGSYYNQPLGSSYGSYSILPKVEPYGWRGQMDSSCYTRYAVLGDSGSHVLVVETRMGIYGQDSSHITFQLQLHEATGELRIVYGPAEGPLPGHTTQTGLMRTATDRIFLGIADGSVYRSASAITLANDAGVWPEQWHCWSLTPDTAACPFPGAVTVVDNDPDITLLSWPSVPGASGYRLGIPAVGLDIVLADTVCPIINMLDGATTYSGTLQTVCGDGHASYREREFSITTANGIIRHLPFVADFNDATTCGNWNYSIAASSTPRWQRKTNSPSPRMYTGYIDNPDYDATAWLISPPITLPAGSDVPLLWDYRSALANVQFFGTPTIDVLVSVCDTTDIIDTSAALWDTLTTIERLVPSFRTYGLTLEGYDGHRVRVAFVRRGKCFGSADIDNVRIGSDETLVRIHAPLHPMVGIENTLQALYAGGDPTAPFVWHSAMAAAGEAILYTNSTAYQTIVYNTTGTDTVIVQHGTAADTLVLLVKDCATVFSYPWNEDFENYADCWTLPDDYSWNLRRYANSAYSGSCSMLSQHTPSSTSHNRLISPTFVLPDAGHITGLAMTFQVRALYNNTSTHLSVYFIPDSLDGGTDTVVFDTLVGWNTYSQCIVPLDGAAGLAGRSGRFALDHWGTASGVKNIYLDDVSIRYVNDPVVHIAAPRNAYTGETETMVATVSEGDCTGLVYAWHSAMLAAGLADTIGSGTDGTLLIDYHAAGIDTLVVSASNGYGISTDTAIVQVCAPVDTYPWQADLSSQGCWYIADGSTWIFTNNRLQAWGDLHQEGTAVTPAIVVPSDTGSVLNWRAYGNAIYTVSVSTGRYDDSYTTVLLDTATSAEGTLQRSISLDAYAGDTIHVAFHLDYQYNVIRIDSLILTNSNRPVVNIDAPQHAFADGNTAVHALFTRGAAGSTLYWSSAMASRGQASLVPTGTSLYIDYFNAGTDTVTVTASNTFGTDSATAIITVSDCDTVDALTWSVNFSTDYDCWYRPSGCNWTPSMSSLYSRVATVPFDSRIISPALAVPATADDSLVVEWTSMATNTQHEHTLYMLVSDGDYTDPTQYDTLVADTITYFQPKTYRVPLGAYANKVIHIAFVNHPIHLASYSYDYRTLWIGNLHTRSLRLPVVRLAMPSATHVGENTTVRAEMTDGSPSGLTYTWHSSMAAAGLATMVIAGDTMRLVYSAAGTDTIQVVATNAYGSDTATATLSVQDCAVIDSLPWAPPYIRYGNITCWRIYNFTTYSNSNWYTFSDLHSGHSSSLEPANNWLVTPAIELPDTLDASAIKWTVRATTITTSGVIYPPYMEVLLTTGDATDTSTFSHVLFSDYINTGFNSSNQRTYEATLDSFAGQTVHIAFVHRGSEGGTIYLDAVSVENGGRPEVGIIPPTALNVGEACRFAADILSGARTGLTYTWHSTMAAAGLATLTATNTQQINITYTSDGVDTITVVAANAYGSDTARVVMPVHNCPPRVLPMYEDFEDSTSAACWNTFAYYWNSYSNYERIPGSWQWSSDSANHYMQTESLAYDYLVSPAIVLPTAPNIADIVLAWEQNSYHPLPMHVVVSPTGLYDGEDDFTDTLCSITASGTNQVSLLAYGGRTVRLAFIASYAYASAMELDNVSVFCEYRNDTVWRTVTVTSNVEGACETYGSGIYTDSSTVEVGYTVADTMPEGGHWQFLGWDDGPTESPRNILVTSDTVIVALFEWVADSVGITTPDIDFSLYPNPAAGDVTVSVGQPSTVSVIDMVGRTVISPTHVNSTFLIQHSSLPSGAYMVRIVNQGGTVVRKLIVKESL